MYDLTLLVLVPLFFAISFVYSSVGFGGGSSYTAILILAGISIFSVPPISLLLNIIVSCMAFSELYKSSIFLSKVKPAISVFNTICVLYGSDGTSTKNYYNNFHNNTFCCICCSLDF